jgi:CheY-like chemotaxis protein
LNKDFLRPPKTSERRYESEFFSTIQEMGSDELIQFNRKLENMSTDYDRKYVFHPHGQEESDPWELRIGRISSGKRYERRDESEHMGYLKVQVIDTGCGISANEIPKLFGMFEQATEHTRSVHGGSGLGLWICKQICQRMNGDITLYSEVNKGSSFVFYIPVETRPRDQLGSMPSMNNERLKALVVDDFPTNRYLHKLLLEQQGVQVTLASDGREAVEKYKGQKAGEDVFRFILMDVNMPGMDGFAAAKRIREFEIEIGKKMTDIYFVTGEYFNEEDVLTRFKNVGGTRSGIKYLNKPLDTEALRKLIINYK